MRTNQMFLRMPERLNRRRVYRQQVIEIQTGLETPCRRYTGTCCIGPDGSHRRTDCPDQTTGRGGKRIEYGLRFDNQRGHGSKAGAAELAGWCLARDIGNPDERKVG